MQWNRFYRTLATPGPEEVSVIGVDQRKKRTGSDHDTWLTCAEPIQDFGNDCLVQVCRLHPTLDGVQQVDKAHDQQLAIRAPLYNDMQRQEIDNAIAHSRPIVQKVRQASQNKILHELTIHHYSAKDHVGNDILPTALEEILQSAGASAAQLPAQAYIRSQHHRLQFSGSILDLQLKACSKYHSCLQLFWAAYQPHIKGPAVTGLSTASEVTCPASVVV